MAFLTPNQINQYKDEGYVAPIDALSKEEVIEEYIENYDCELAFD